MKLRIRYKSKNNILTIDDEVAHHVTLIDICSTARELFFDNLPSNFGLSLNKKDLLEGDDKLLSDFGIINGDLIHVINLDPEPEETEPPCQSSSHLSSQSSNSKSGQSSTENKANDKSASSSGTSNRFCEEQQKALEDRSNDSEMCDMQSSNDTEDEPPIDYVVVNRYLNEPMLCRDSTESRVPVVLEQLFVNSGVNNSHDALCVLLHVMMVEAGYQSIHQPPDGVTEESTLTMPDDWSRRSPACTTLRYTHTSCRDVESSFVLTCVPMCSLLVVHGISSGVKKGEQVQLQLDTTEYIADINQGAVKCYKHLKKLSRLFKDTVALPMLQSFQEVNGMLPIHGTMALSNELKLKIFGYLNVEAVLTCSEVCKEFYSISRDRYIWRRLFVKEFGNRLHKEMNLSRDWFELYKREYKQRKERRKMLNQMTMVVPPVFFPPTHRPIPMPQGPYYPGVLGGDYDLNPHFPGIPGPSFGPNRPLMRPRFDPVGPLPEHNIFPNRRGPRGPFGGGGFGGPRFF